MDRIVKNYWEGSVKTKFPVGSRPYKEVILEFNALVGTPIAKFAGTPMTFYGKGGYVFLIGWDNKTAAVALSTARHTKTDPGTYVAPPAPPVTVPGYMAPGGASAPGGATGAAAGGLVSGLIQGAGQGLQKSPTDDSQKDDSPGVLPVVVLGGVALGFVGLLYYLSTRE